MERERIEEGRNEKGREAHNKRKGKCVNRIREELVEEQYRIERERVEEGKGKE